MSKEQLSFDNTEVAFRHYSNNALQRAFSVYRLISNPVLNNIGATLAKVALAVHFPIKPFVKPLIFKQFCGGETLNECQSTICLLQQLGVSANLHFGVEFKKSEKEFDNTLERNIGAVEFAGRNSNVKVLSCKVTGMGFFEIIQKIQEQEPLSEKERKSFERTKERVHELCALAATNGTKIYWDAEETWVQDVIDELVDELMEKYNKDQVIVYNTFQMYRHDRLQFLKDSIARAKEKGYLLGAKIVRGAYMEKEREWAEDHEIPSPIHEDKAAVDKDFDAAVVCCLEDIDTVSVCVASHNEASSLHATQEMKLRGIPNNHHHVWFSQLFGMGEHITYNLANHGYNATKYIPYGPVKEVIPYLIRRAQENSSVDGQMSRELSIIQVELKRRNL